MLSVQDSNTQESFPHERGGGPHRLDALGAAALGFPHERGGGPDDELVDRWTSMFSPHTWGWAVGLLLYVVDLMSFPHMRGGGPYEKVLTNGES